MTTLNSTPRIFSIACVNVLFANLRANQDYQSTDSGLVKTGAATIATMRGNWKSRIKDTCSTSQFGVSKEIKTAVIKKEYIKELAYSYAA